MSMKIVAGIGSIDDYENYVQAGADECFCGYVPGEYMMRYGRKYPANRREVVYYNVQIGSESELLILRKMIEKYNVPVSIAFNGLYYGDEQRAFLIDTIRKCIAMGYADVIVAEPTLIKALGGVEGIRITVSGEIGELNENVLSSIYNERIRRFIYPRQTTIEEMMRLKAKWSEKADLEYEAFTLNEKCHFTGAYCNSLHCDELCHMCKLPYRIYDKQGGVAAGSECNEPCEIGNCQNDAPDEYEYVNECADEYIVGTTGCALCLLWKYREVGVTHLKLVSRGNSTEATCEDIRSLRKALDILERSESEEEYKRRLFDEIFPKGCGGNCYTRKRQI